VQQCCDRLVFVAAIFEHDGSDFQKMGIIRDITAFSPLRTVELKGQEQRTGKPIG